MRPSCLDLGRPHADEDDLRALIGVTLPSLCTWRRAGGGVDDRQARSDAAFSTALGDAIGLKMVTLRADLVELVDKLAPLARSPRTT